VHIASQLTFPTRLVARLADLTPAHFGMVMATGIVSIAVHLLAPGALARVLFDLNIGVYALLSALTIMRAAAHPRRLLADLTDHQRGPAFFAVVAGTGVLGSQAVLLAGAYATATLMLAVAVVLWIAATYMVFVGLTIKDVKPALDQGISGTWLLTVVATQSIAVLSALLAAHAAEPWRLQLDFVALSMWLLGGMLYIWMISLIFYRYTFLRFRPADLSPPYWINMGAMAISTLAGALLIVNAHDEPLLASLLPFLKGFTLLYWATGTWWIPMLVVLALWRYVYRRFPLRFDPLYWAAVFPLGMYAASTHEMVNALGLPFLASVPTLFLYLALIAWTATFTGLLVDVGRRLRGLARRA
jgi:tellurite resistance protein TehA-like permease